MGKDMTYYLFIGMFQGLVSMTKAFRKEKDAKEAFYNFTGFEWDLINTEEKTYIELGGGDYIGSQVSELQIEA